jgi:hypothetical protein
MSTDSATIRVTRPGQFVAGFVPYRVVIDDIEYGKIRSNRRITVSVNPGQHMVQVLGRSPSGSSSNVLNVNVRPDAICEIGCRSVVSIGSLVRNGLSFGLGKPPVSIVLYET